MYFLTEVASHVLRVSGFFFRLIANHPGVERAVAAALTFHFHLSNFFFTCFLEILALSALPIRSRWFGTHTLQVDSDAFTMAAEHERALLILLFSADNAMAPVIEINVLFLLVELIIKVNLSVFEAVDLTVFGLDFVEGLAANGAGIGGLASPLANAGQTKGMTALKLVERSGAVTNGTLFVHLIYSYNLKEWAVRFLSTSMFLI